MLQITPHMRILVAVEPVDFRKGIDGLAKVCRTVLEEQPFSGTIFVFRNRKRSAIKLLVYDGQGFWHCQKRLSMGKFRSWPSHSESSAVALQAHQLQILLRGGDPETIFAAPDWRPLLQGVATIEQRV